MPSQAINNVVNVAIDTVADFLAINGGGSPIIDDEKLSNGWRCWVSAALPADLPTRGLWLLDKLSTAVVNNVTVCATFSGVGRFLFFGSGVSGAGGITHEARGVVEANIPALGAFVVAGNDGLTYTAGQRLLSVGQAAGQENGIYVVGVVVAGLAPLTRPTDWQTGSVIASALVTISEGTLYHDSLWQVTTDGPIVVGTTPVALEEIDEAPAGGVGNTLHVTAAGRVGWGPLNLAGGANYVGGLLPIANGGTGVASLLTKAYTATDGAGAVVPVVPGPNAFATTNAAGLPNATTPAAAAIVNTNGANVIGSAVPGVRAYVTTDAAGLVSAPGNIPGPGAFATTDVAGTPNALVGAANSLVVKDLANLPATVAPGLAAVVTTNLAGVIGGTILGASKTVLTSAAGLLVGVDSAVDQLQDLIAMNTTVLPEGYSVLVREYGQPFRLRVSTLTATSLLTSKAIEVVAPGAAPDSATKRWIRDFSVVSNSTYITGDWYVEQVVYGSGTANGMITPLVPGVSATFVGANTLPAPGAGFDASSVGKYVNVLNAASPFNQGAFKILAVTSATTCTIECKYAVATGAVLTWNVTLGYNGADGQSAATPLLNVAEHDLRRYWTATADANGVLPTGNACDRIIMRSNFAATGTFTATDAWTPSFLIVSSGGLNPSSGQIAYAPTLVGGFRSHFPVTGSTKLLTENGTLANSILRTKSTWVDSAAVVATGVNATTSVGNKIMVADLATLAASTATVGTVAVTSVTPSTGFAIITCAFGAGGFSLTNSLFRMVTLSGFANAGNNSTFIISRVISTTSVEVTFAAATPMVVEAAPALGTCVEKNPKVAWIVKAPGDSAANGGPITSGTFATGVTAVNAGILTLAGSTFAGGGTAWSNLSIGSRIRLSYAAGGNANNVADWTVTARLSATSIQVANGTKKTTATAAIGQGISAVVPGVSITFTASAGSIATFASDSVTAQRWVTISGSATAANNGDYPVIAVTPTSVTLGTAKAGTAIDAGGTVAAEYQVLGVVDGTALTYQGLVEVGPYWYDQTANPFLVLPNTAAIAAPLSGSPYVVVKLPRATGRVSNVGVPRGLVVNVINWESGSGIGPYGGGNLQLLGCKSDRSVSTFLPGSSGGTVQTRVDSEDGCYIAIAPFTTMTMQENAHQGNRNTVFIDYRIDVREARVTFGVLNTMIQSGYVSFGNRGDEAGSRNHGAPATISATTAVIGASVFNNANGASAQPAAGGASGACVILDRKVDVASCLGVNAGTLWGIGANMGVAVRGGASLMLGAANLPRITSTAGSAGYPEQEVRIDSTSTLASASPSTPAIPSVSALTGVPTAIAVSAPSGDATLTRDAVAPSGGIMTLVGLGMTFDPVASVGRTLTFGVAFLAPNRGTFTITRYIGPTSVEFRNLAGVPEVLVVAAGVVENPVITRWTQLMAAPYSGNAVNYVNETSIIRNTEA